MSLTAVLIGVGIFAAGGIIAWVLFRRPKQQGVSLEQTAAEDDAKAARMEAAELKSQLGTTKAVAEIRAKNQAKLEALDTKVREEADALEDDPEALAEFLARA